MKGISSKFEKNYRIRQTPEEIWSVQCQKVCEYNNYDEIAEWKWKTCDNDNYSSKNFNINNKLIWQFLVKYSNTSNIIMLKHTSEALAIILFKCNQRETLNNRILKKCPGSKINFRIQFWMNQMLKNVSWTEELLKIIAENLLVKSVLSCLQRKLTKWNLWSRNKLLAFILSIVLH